MTHVEMDNWCVRALRSLHSSSTESHSILRNLLDEAIKTKFGVGKENASFINISPAFQEFPVGTTMIIETMPKETMIKPALESDSELELDLLKEDLTCNICKGMGVGARNRLVECSDCHHLYHQECHQPKVTDEEVEISGWICLRCTGATASKLVKKSASSQNINVPTSHKCNKLPVQSKLSSDKDITESSTSKSSSSTKSSSKSSHISSNRMLTPNINIISADKRIQSMKKKAAKLQEKRKLSR